MNFELLLNEALDHSGSDDCASVAVFRDNDGVLEVLLVTRKSDPQKGKWCLPGGHADEGETIEDAAIRELKEESGIELNKDDLIKVGIDQSGESGRDQSQPFVDAVFAAKFPPNATPHAGSDAGTVRWYPVDKVPDLAFNHKEFVEMAKDKIDDKKMFEWVMKEFFNNEHVILEDKRRVQNGTLIVFDGVDGAGKTTQADKLFDWLKDNDYDVVRSNWKSSEILTKAIKKAKKKKILTPKLYSLLHMADMLLRYEQDITKALANGSIVICDRYIYTSMTRDGVRGVDESLPQMIYDGMRDPDIVFYCAISTALATERVISRDKIKDIPYYAAGLDLGISLNKEKSLRKYQDMVNKKYDKIMPKIEHCHKLNMERPPKEIHKEVRKIVEKEIGNRRFNVTESKKIILNGEMYLIEAAIRL